MSIKKQLKWLAILSVVLATVDIALDKYGSATYCILMYILQMYLYNKEKDEK